jgi:hypothetical protein
MEARSSSVALGAMKAISGTGRRKWQRSYTEMEIKWALPSHQRLMVDKVATSTRGVGCRNRGAYRRRWATR